MQNNQKVAEQRRQWHLDKTFSVSHLISTIAAITALVVMGSKFDTRVSLIEQAVIAQKMIDSRQDADIAETRTSIRQDLRDINGKIDRVIEKLVAQK